MGERDERKRRNRGSGSPGQEINGVSISEFKRRNSGQSKEVQEKPYQPQTETKGENYQGQIPTGEEIRKNARKKIGKIIHDLGIGYTMFTMEVFGDPEGDKILSRCTEPTRQMLYFSNLGKKSNYDT